ncbi:MAG TPA: DegT/DnrJ/EryC1/StrS aminotransferase family protein [Thermoanaerobaculia bacterium]|nr:DegT/DnrJ/EryC1/StrS aminotransferase family protein [Thermoanaerobaculia bacterium]
MDEFIPVAAPALSGNEKRYVNECLDTTWISSIGSFISRFEEQFAASAGVGYAVSCNNGTSALHLALLGLGVGPGDEVLVPSLTYIATANAVRYCGALPVFVDSDRETWNLTAEDLRAKLTPRTRAVIAVHLYGRPAPMREILIVAREAGIKVIEDAAEAVGATYQGRPVGSLADVAAFSFFGNKIITCGEGGMITTDDEALGRKIRQLKGQGQDFERRYFFPVVGYNYRMTNIQAALGLAQLEQIDAYLAQRDEIAAWYRSELAGVPGLHLPAPDREERSVCWLWSVVLTHHAGDRRDAVMAHLKEAGIETRPFFYPCHIMPPYAATGREARCPEAEWLSERGLSLPTWIGMTRQHVCRIAAALVAALDAVAVSPVRSVQVSS